MCKVSRRLFSVLTESWDREFSIPVYYVISVCLWVDEGESDSHISSSFRAITHKRLFCFDCSFVCFHSGSWETSGSWSVFMALNSLAILVRCLLRAFTWLIKMLTFSRLLRGCVFIRVGSEWMHYPYYRLYIQTWCTDKRETETCRLPLC